MNDCIEDVLHSLRVSPMEKHAIQELYDENLRYRAALLRIANYRGRYANGLKLAAVEALRDQ